MSGCARHFGLPRTSAATIRGDKKTQTLGSWWKGPQPLTLPPSVCPAWGGHFLPVTVDFMGSGGPRYYNIFRNDSRGEHTAQTPTLSCNSVLSCIHQRSVTVPLCDSTSPPPPLTLQKDTEHGVWELAGRTRGRGPVCSSWPAGYVPAEAASWWEPPKKPIWIKGDWELLPAGSRQNPGARLAQGGNS